MSEAPPRHLSIRLFHPYERNAKHEGQLTRAAPIVKVLSAFDGRLRDRASTSPNWRGERLQMVDSRAQVESGREQRRIGQDDA